MKKGLRHVVVKYQSCLLVVSRDVGTSTSGSIRIEHILFCGNLNMQPSTSAVRFCVSGMFVNTI